MRYAQINRAGEVLVFLDGDPAQWPDLVAANALRSCGPEVQAGWVWTNGAFVPPPQGATRRVVTPLDFRRRFTAPERGAITRAAAQGVAQGWTQLQEFIDDLASAAEVDLDSPDLREGMDLLVHYDLLTPARRLEILS